MGPSSAATERAPYGIIADKLLSGGVVPFLGAGASLTARDGDACFDGRSPRCLPTAGELSSWLAGKCEFPKDETPDLAKVASYLQVQSTRSDLIDYLRQIFSRDYPYGSIHRLLAGVPRPMLIVTTNYDDLIERAFDDAGKPYHLVMHPESDDKRAGAVRWWKPGATKPDESFTPSTLPLTVTDTTIIYKMHGSVQRSEAQREWDSFIITEEDYISFLARMTAKSGAVPSNFMLHIRNSSLLFLGYGLRDWNLRVMLQNLRRTFAAHDKLTDVDDADSALAAEQGTAKASWAVQRRPSELERTLWSSRRVKIFDQDLTEFAEALWKKMQS